MSGGRRHATELALDGVVSAQPELGPAAPDGGYGWLVFVATLFFQALIPSLVVSYGIFLVFDSIQTLSGNSKDVDPLIWDNKIFYVPLTFIATWTLFDPKSRQLIASSTWPRLVATAATCLTCAGLLFLWMGLTGYRNAQSAFFLLSGLISGIGASLQMSQCEILLSQYFRYRLTLISHISHAACAMGFMIVPIILGHNILNSTHTHIILWYQAIILWGLIFNLTFKKAQYLKPRPPATYNYITANPDDEEDIFSKNSRELQIRRQNSDGTTNKIEKHPIPNNNSDQPGPSHETNSQDNKNWIKFDEEKDIKNDWETFEEDSGVSTETTSAKPTKWETFEEDETQKSPKVKNLQLELAFAEQKGREEQSPPVMAAMPSPLFSDLPVNNNNTYSFEALDDELPPQPVVFMPTTIPNKRHLLTTLEILKQPTFYKSLLMVMTTKYSVFIFYTLYPSYIYQELPRIKLRAVCTLAGITSISALLFSAISYWVNIDKRRRPICLWLLSWIGAVGYYMISDYQSEYLLLFGAVQITLSMSALQHVGWPLLGLTIRGEPTNEYCVISLLTGSSFIFFYIIDASFKNCFRLMALLHFFTGGIWFGNFLYKRFVLR